MITEPYSIAKLTVWFWVGVVSIDAETVLKGMRFDEATVSSARLRWDIEVDTI